VVERLGQRLLDTPAAAVTDGQYGELAELAAALEVLSGELAETVN